MGGTMTPDMRGKRIGHLEVIERAPSKFRANGECRGAAWLVRCRCGATYSLLGRDLRTMGKTFGDDARCRDCRP